MTAPWLIRVLCPAAFLSLSATLAAQAVVINEFKCDTPGPDTGEFIELFAYDPATGAAIPHQALDGYVLVFFNGSSPTNAAYTVTPVGGTASASIKLDGRTTNASGFFVIGSPAVPGVDLTLHPGANGWFQNGADGVGLYKNPAAEFTTSTGPTAADLVDAIVYGTDDPEDADLLAALAPGAGQINETPNSLLSLARRPDGGAPFASGVFEAREPTPGSLNQPVAALTLTLWPATLVEGGSRFGTVTRDGSTAAAATVSFASSDGSELSAPATVEIPAGAASAPVLIEAQDDLWPDGSQTAELAASSPGYVPAVLAVTVMDNGDMPQPLVINEVFPTGRGDANGDGANATNQDRFNDEFVEIVNRGTAAADLSGFQLYTSSIASPRHAFPPGTVLLPGGALVVFGGGTLAPGATGAFGTAWIQTANAPILGLYLLEPSGRLSLTNAAGREVAGFRYDTEAGALDSVTLNPDGTGQPAPHASVGDGSVFYSPGLRADGTPFRTLTVRLAPEVTPAAIVENAGKSAALLTVRREAPFTSPLLVTILSSDPTEAVPAASTLNIPAGEEAASLAIDAIDDTAQDGPREVHFTVIAAGHLNGIASLQVSDDGRDAPAATLFINEIDSDQPGPDSGEFIELFIGEPAARALDGYVVVLFNGNHPSKGAYAVFDLTGRSSNTRGLFLLGNAAVPHVDFVIPDASLQNGTDAVAVYRAPASRFVTGGTPSPPTPEGLVDVLVYGNGSGEDAALLAAFQRVGDPSVPPLAQQNEGESNNSTALARLPDATEAYGAFAVQPPTPGAPNSPETALAPAISVSVEDGNLIVTFTGRLEESSTLEPESFAPVAGATSPHVIPLPSGGARYFRASTP